MDSITSAAKMIELFWLACFSEFVGTAVLIILGNGVCASTTFKRMFANQPGKWVAIIFGWGFAVFVAAIISSMMGGLGHLNPAVTIMDAIKTSYYVGQPSMESALNGSIYYYAMMGYSITLSESIALTFFMFVLFQITGAMFGQAVLNFINLKFLKDKENDILSIRGTHCTTPAYSNKEEKSLIQNFSYELIGTMILIGFVLGLGGINFKTQDVGALSTIPVAFLVMSIGLSLGSATGYAINPARDFGPRVIYGLYMSIVRKEEWNKSLFNCGYSWVPIVAPLVGGSLIGLFALIPTAIQPMLFPAV